MGTTEQDINEAAYACHKAAALLRMAEAVAETFDAAALPSELKAKANDLRETITVARELISREIYAPLLAIQEGEARNANSEKTRRSPG